MPGTAGMRFPFLFPERKTEEEKRQIMKKRITEKAHREGGLEIHTKRLRIRFVWSDWKALMEIWAMQSLGICAV